MAEQLPFKDSRVQSLLLDITRELFARDMLEQIRRYGSRRQEFTKDSPQTQELLQRALGAETLFAVWKQPVPDNDIPILHIVKVDSEGSIIPGLETMVGSFYDGRAIARSGIFSDDDVALTAAFTDRQDALPWQPDTSTTLLQA